MALVGVICPYDDTKQLFDTCIACHERGDPNRNCAAPVALLKLAKENDNSRKNAGISASTLNSCARAHALQKTYDYYEPVISAWNKARGTWVHAMIESDKTPKAGIIRERRIEKYLDMLDEDELLRITGQPDEVDTERGILIDYKSAESVPKEPKYPHETQFNVYVWLLNGGVMLPESGSRKKPEPINCIITGGGMHYVTWRTKAPVFKKIAYPVWETERIEEWMRERARPIVHWQKTGEIPQCNALIRYPGKYWRCDCVKLEEQFADG